MRIQHIMAVLIVAMLSGACSSGSGNGDNGDGSGAGDGGAHTGSLVVGGSRFVQTLDLTADTGWTRLLEYTIGNALPAVHVPASELFMGRFTLADPYHIDVHALLPFSGTAVRQTDWPGTELTVRMRGLAVSPGGQYIAAVMSDTVGTRQIEVLTDAAAGSEVVITVFRGSPVSSPAGPERPLPRCGLSWNAGSSPPAALPRPDLSCRSSYWRSPRFPATHLPRCAPNCCSVRMKQRPCLRHVSLRNSRGCSPRGKQWSPGDRPCRNWSSPRGSPLLSVRRGKRVQSLR